MIVAYDLGRHYPGDELVHNGAEFSTGKNNWLIPDNVQEQPYRIAERISPTNLGFLFNARQAALEFELGGGSCICICQHECRDFAIDIREQDLA